MTPEQEKTMEVLTDLFLSDGWKIFQTDIENNIISVHQNIFDTVDESKEFFKNKGKIETLRFIRNYENMIKHNYNQLIESENENDL